MKQLVLGLLVLLLAWGCDSVRDSEPTLADLVLSEPTLWLSKDKAVFSGDYHTLPSGLHWSTTIGRSLKVVAHKAVRAEVTCSMPSDAGRKQAAAYARCVEAMVEVCDVGLQHPVEEGDTTITTTGYNILETHDDGSITLTPCKVEDN